MVSAWGEGASNPSRSKSFPTRSVAVSVAFNLLLFSDKILLSLVPPLPSTSKRFASEVVVVVTAPGCASPMVVEAANGYAAASVTLVILPVPNDALLPLLIMFAAGSSALTAVPASCSILTRPPMEKSAPVVEDDAASTSASTCVTAPPLSKFKPSELLAMSASEVKSAGATGEDALFSCWGSSTTVVAAASAGVGFGVSAAPLMRQSSADIVPFSRYGCSDER
mmetsp:Transcript_2525/g.5876  ORF Transcript_2525/g.5876 Transcript_2525/m.5876 type:complete len:224 (-) Transcript_2525:88-759(-)